VATTDLSIDPKSKVVRGPIQFQKKGSHLLSKKLSKIKQDRRMKDEKEVIM
jgi:hypothetical protein